MGVDGHGQGGIGLVRHLPDGVVVVAAANHIPHDGGVVGGLGGEGLPAAGARPVWRRGGTAQWRCPARRV